MTEKNEDIVEIFTDGACSGNPGPGGYGAILKFGRKIKEISGCEFRTTNNRMEMMAVIVALGQLKRPCQVRIASDSDYLIKGMTKWTPGWIKRNWINSKKEPVRNRDLWEQLLKLAAPHQIEWEWIKGHHGHKENERCDELAKAALKECVAEGRKRKNPDEKWMRILGKMTYGIYVLTTHHEGEINGMIASWVSQISYDPPLIMAAVHHKRFSHDMILESGYFTLHLISKKQKSLLRRFKGHDREAKFKSIPWKKGKTGCPVLEECIGYMECAVRYSYSPGNHTLFIGEVLDAEDLSIETPLTTLDYEGVYTGKD